MTSPPTPFPQKKYVMFYNMYKYVISGTQHARAYACWVGTYNMHATDSHFRRVYKHAAVVLRWNMRRGQTSLVQSAARQL